jgi:hypothetical protein
VEQDGISYVTIEVTLANKIHESSGKGDEAISNGYFSRLKDQELFKHLFKEIVDYLDDNEAEMFLLNVIDDIVKMIGGGSIYLDAALRELDALYLATGETVKREKLKKETDVYFKWILNALKEETNQKLKEQAANLLKEAAAKRGEEVTYEKELC